MDKIIQYSFSRNLKITKKNALELLIASDFLMIDELVHECMSFVRCNLSQKNCLDVYSISLWLNHLCLSEFCNRFITVYFEDIVKRDTCPFSNLNVENLLKLFAKRDLNVADEMTVWRVLETWLEKDRQNRITFLPHLLDFLQLTEEEKSAIKSTYSIKLENMISSVKLFRRPQPPLASYFICTNRMFGNVCYVTYDDKFDFWRKVIAIDHTPHSIICGTNACVYLFNHYNVSLLDVARDTLTTLAEFRMTRLDYGHAVVRDRLYIIGGTVYFPRYTQLRSVDCFDVETGRWLWVQSTLHPCKGPVVVVRDKIYAFGTRFDIEMQRTVLSGECYDPAMNKWALLKPVQAPFENHFSVFALRDRIYVCGKEKKRVYLMCYDAVTKHWMNENASSVLHCSFKEPEICKLLSTVVIYEASDDAKHPKSYVWDELRHKWKVPEENILRDLRKYHISCITDKESLRKLRDRSSYKWKRCEEY